MQPDSIYGGDRPGSGVHYLQKPVAGGSNPPAPANFRCRVDVDQTDLATVTRLSLDTMPKRRVKVLLDIGPDGAPIGTEKRSTRYVLEELELLGAVEISGTVATKGRGRQVWQWTDITREFIGNLESATLKSYLGLSGL